MQDVSWVAMVGFNIGYIGLDSAAFLMQPWHDQEACWDVCFQGLGAIVAAGGLANFQKLSCEQKQALLPKEIRVEFAFC